MSHLRRFPQTAVIALCIFSIALPAHSAEQLAPRALTLCGLLLGHASSHSRQQKMEEGVADQSMQRTLMDVTDRLEALHDREIDQKWIHPEMVVGFEKVNISELYSPVGSDTISRFNIHKAVGQLDLIHQQLKAPDDDTTLVFSEIRGKQAIQSFIAAVLLKEPELSSSVETEIDERIGETKNERLDAQLGRKGFLGWMSLLSTAFLGAVSYWTAPEYSLEPGMLMVYGMLAAIWGIKDNRNMAVGALKNTFGSKATRQNERIKEENKLFYRGHHLFEFLHKAIAYLELDLTNEDFAYFSQTVKLSPHHSSYLGSLVKSNPDDLDPDTLASAEVDQLFSYYGYGRERSAELSLNLFLDMDPGNGEPGLLIVSRVSGTPKEPPFRKKKKREKKPLKNPLEDLEIPGILGPQPQPELIPIPVKAK